MEAPRPDSARPRATRLATWAMLVSLLLSPAVLPAPNFALLLGGDEDSDEETGGIAWITIASIGAYPLFIAIVILVYGQVYAKKYKGKEHLRTRALRGKQWQHGNRSLIRASSSSKQVGDPAIAILVTYDPSGSAVSVLDLTDELPGGDVAGFGALPGGNAVVLFVDGSLYEIDAQGAASLRSGSGAGSGPQIVQAGPLVVEPAGTIAVLAHRVDAASGMALVRIDVPTGARTVVGMLPIQHSTVGDMVLDSPTTVLATLDNDDPGVARDRIFRISLLNPIPSPVGLPSTFVAQDLAFDAAFNRLFASSRYESAVASMDLLAGTPQLSVLAGKGPDFAPAAFLAFDDAGQLLLADDQPHSVGPRVLRVDGTTGNRFYHSVFSDGTVSGPPVTGKGGASLADGTTVATHAEDGTVVLMDATTGDRSLLADNVTHGTGPDLDTPKEPVVDGADNVFVYNAGTGEILAVGAATGDRTLVSGPGRGSGAALPTGAAFDELAVSADGSTFYVFSDGADILAVDATTGDRSVVAGTAATLTDVYSVSRSSDGTFVLTNTAVSGIGVSGVYRFDGSSLTPIATAPAQVDRVLGVLESDGEPMVVGGHVAGEERDTLFFVDVPTNDWSVATTVPRCGDVFQKPAATFSNEWETTVAPDETDVWIPLGGSPASLRFTSLAGPITVRASVDPVDVDTGPVTLGGAERSDLSRVSIEPVGSPPAFSAEVRLRFSPTLARHAGVDPGDACIAFSDDGGSSWECSSSTTPDPDDEHGLVCGETTHFSLWTIAESPSSGVGDWSVFD